MGVLAAQGFEFMGCEIDHEQAAAGMKYAARLEQGPSGVVKVVQNLVNDDEISRTVGKGQGIDFSLPDLGMTQRLFFKVRPGDGKHLAARIDADGLFRLGSEKFQDPARAGT